MRNRLSGSFDGSFAEGGDGVTVAEMLFG